MGSRRPLQGVVGAGAGNPIDHFLCGEVLVPRSTLNCRFASSPSSRVGPRDPVVHGWQRCDSQHTRLSGMAY